MAILEMRASLLPVLKSEYRVAKESLERLE